MRHYTIALVIALSLSGCGDPTYERRDGPRLPAAERRGILEYKHSLSANLCYPELQVARDAAREFRTFEPLLREKPGALIKTKVAYSDYGDVPEDMALREYAEETRDRLRENDAHLPGRARRCQLHYARRLGRLLR